MEKVRGKKDEEEGRLHEQRTGRERIHHLNDTTDDAVVRTADGRLSEMLTTARSRASMYLGPQLEGAPLATVTTVVFRELPPAPYSFFLKLPRLCYFNNLLLDKWSFKYAQPAISCYYFSFLSD